METQRPNQAGAEPAGSPDPEAQPGDPARIVALVTPSSGVVVDALRRLGPDVQLLVAHDDVPARSLLASGDVDLLVVDQGATADWLPLLEDVRAKGGPPALVLCREGGDSTALAAFRAGASDCLAPGPALAETLPVAALEAIRRGRAVRAALRADHLERHVDSLERTTRNIVQNMSGALLVLDPQGRISWTNRRAEELLGVELDGLEGQPAADWFPGVPRAELFSARTLREGVRFRDVETMLTRAGGDVVPVSLSCSPLVRDDGSRSGAVLVLQDLSELKQLQRQVLQNEKMASIGQLAAGVAHEINNPMGFIHANLCQLSEYLDDLGKVWERTKALRQAAAGSGVAEPVAAAARELEASIAEVDAEFLITDFGKAIGESLEGSERIRHIVQDLRAFSHQDTAERVLADVNKALDSTANIVWTMMKHSVVLTKHYEELPPIPCFPMQLKQVFMNLLVNAYQAIEARAAEEAVRGEIRLRTGVVDDGVRVAVTDNGAGIDAATQARIFDPFFTTKEVGVGTGLGLSTCFTLVRRHGGRLQVESEPGHATTFEVWLPLAGPPPEAEG